MMRVVKHQNWLPGEAADTTSLETFMVRLDGALGATDLIEDIPVQSRGLDWMTFEYPFQPKLCCRPKSVTLQ